MGGFGRRRLGRILVLFFSEGYQIASTDSNDVDLVSSRVSDVMDRMMIVRRAVGG